VKKVWVDTIETSEACFRFPNIGLFINQSASKATEMENRGHISYFLTPVKFRKK